MRFEWLSVSLAAMAMALPAAAQDVVGSTIVEGRSVQLLSDLTSGIGRPRAFSAEAAAGSAQKTL